MTVQLHPTRGPPDPRPVASMQGTLALDFGGQCAVAQSPDLRLVPGDRAHLEAFAHRFASAVVEVVGGDRGPSQLLRWTSEQVYADLQRRSALLRRTTPGDRRRPPAAQPGAQRAPVLPLARRGRDQRARPPGRALARHRRTHRPARGPVVLHRPPVRLTPPRSAAGAGGEAVRSWGPPGAPWHFLYFLPEPQGHSALRLAPA